MKNSKHFIQDRVNEFWIRGANEILGRKKFGIGKNEVRIAFILDCKKLIRAVKIIKLGLIAYKEKHPLVIEWSNKIYL